MTDELLIIDADRGYAEALAGYLERHRFEVSIAGSRGEARSFLDNPSLQLLIVRSDIEDTKTASLLKKIKSNNPLIQMIVITESETLTEAIELFGDDARAYLALPVNSRALNMALKQAREWISVQERLKRYTEQLGNLHTAETLYHELFDQAPCYISVQDREFRIIASNRLFRRDFGAEIGSFCYELYKHRSSPCPDCPVEATFEDGKNHQTEEIVTSKSGRQYNVLTWTSPIRAADGTITHVMEMSTNITQIRRLQDHLTSLGLMLGSMSHGVKGMLTALDGGVYQLETGLQKKDDQRVLRAFEQIKEMTIRIRKMVLEILYYAKARELNYQSVDIAGLADIVLDTVTPAAGENDVTLHHDFDRELGEFEVDAGWLQAALVNFLENAVDACVLDREGKDHFVRFTVSLIDPDRVCFVVEDNGMGMDQETREKMFTLFFSSKGSGGTGLGMFIANHVIRQHIGSIDVSSTPGKGSRFVICLPKKRSAGKRRLIDMPHETG